eukprot:15506652-Heterocapsa_arctica.AAC.1
MDVMTDCESLWGTKQGHNIPLKANLLPDLAILRQASALKMTRRNIWAPTDDMVVDGLTKELDDQSPLRKLAEG